MLCGFLLSKYFLSAKVNIGKLNELLRHLQAKKRAFLGNDATIWTWFSSIQKTIEFISYRAGWCTISGKFAHWYHCTLSHSIVYIEASQSQNLRGADQTGQCWVRRKQWSGLSHIQDSRAIKPLPSTYASGGVWGMCTLPPLKNQNFSVFSSEKKSILSTFKAFSYRFLVKISLYTHTPAQPPYILPPNFDSSRGPWLYQNDF
jgi:hypothetical protein